MWKKVLVFLVFCGFVALSAETLPHNLTPEEREYLRSNHSSYLESKYSASRTRARAPEGITYAPAEFDPAAAMIIAWEGYSTLQKQFVKFVAETDKVLVACDGTSTINSAKSTLTGYGVNMANVEFLSTPLDSVWIRDYGPWWTYTQSGNREVIDLDYNRPRPNDDKFPENFAKARNLTNHKCGLILAGGNLILDGHGVAIMTTIVFDASEGGDPDLSVAELEKYMKDYFGVKKVILLKPMNNDGTGHVDMYCKLLTEDTFIVGEYKDAQSGATGNYQILNENAAKLAGETNGLGKPFKVVRIPMPTGSSSWSYTTYSYTNSLIFNKKVLVPVYGFDDEEQALSIYREILPGYDVMGFDCNSIITANGAIHCITKLEMKDPLDLKHDAVDRTRAGEETEIRFAVDSVRGINPEGTRIYWSQQRTGPFHQVAVKNENGVFSGLIPPQAAGTVYYYLETENVEGMYETLPEQAPEQDVFT
ncbi:MAG: agmatine deiminase family protein, partial [Candidatus Wallbacteria bacterium]|nr:agmatine deiminase family protein [Candidatus Wallbacteria bacterium]